MRSGLVTETKPGQLPVIQMTVDIPKPLEETWNLFLNELVMLQWLGNEITANLKEGGKIQFLGDNAPHSPEVASHWDIRKIREKRALLLEWEILGVETLVVFKFSPIETGTLIELNHGPVPSAARSLNMPEHWTIMLANFKSFVVLGEPAHRFDYSDYHPLRPTRYDRKEVRQSVLVRAPPELPFDVWTNPEKLKRFIQAEDPVVDRRYAGLYTWWAEGKGPVVFKKLEENEEIEFSWVYGDEPETIVNIRLEQVEGDTLVTLHHHGFRKPEDVIGYRVGWASVLCELKLVCELGDSGITRIRGWGEGP